jgi:hypothetical protein
MLIFRCTNRNPIIRACALCPSSVALAAFLRALWQAAGTAAFDHSISY